MTDKPTHTPLPCPNPWCASHQTTDPQIRAFHAPIVVPRGKLYQVACPVCPVQTPLYATEAEALTAWNTRAVNSHHDLIEALRVARSVLAQITSGEAFREMRFAEDDDAEYHLRRERKAKIFARDAAVKIDAILTKAEAGR